MNFLNLPGELRNRIYRYLVISDTPIHVLDLHWTKDGTGYEPASTPQPALSLTCKTIRQELLSLYCGENVFEFGMTPGGHQLCMTEVSEALQQWIPSLGNGARHLRQVNVSANCEIMGPRHYGYLSRDFWEIIEFSIGVGGKTGLEYRLRGDPSFDVLCTCELDQWIADDSPRLADVLLRASRLWFRTTDLVECDACHRPWLREPDKPAAFATSSSCTEDIHGAASRIETLQGYLGDRRSRTSFHQALNAVCLTARDFRRGCLRFFYRCR